MPTQQSGQTEESSRKDFATAQFGTILLLLSLATNFSFPLASVDIKKAYLQSKAIKRLIPFRPTKEVNRLRYILWKLHKLPYGITETGRHSAKEIEKWLVHKYGLERVFGVRELYIKRHKLGNFAFICRQIHGQYFTNVRNTLLTKLY